MNIWHGLAFVLIFQTLYLPGVRADDEAKRREISSPATREQLDQFRDLLLRQRQRGFQEPNDEVSPTDSYVKDFLVYVWKEPEARYMAGALVIGEVIFASMLWKATAGNVNTWHRQLGDVRAISQNIREATNAFRAAERDLVRSLSSMEQADRAELLKKTGEMHPRTRAMLERALNSTTPTPAAKPALPLEEATKNLEKTYKDWQAKAAKETEVFQRQRLRVTIPKTMQEATQFADQRTRAMTRLSYTSGEFYKFRNDTLAHMARQARLRLGIGVGWRTKVWRGTRTGLIMAAVPITVLGIRYYFHHEAERNKRLQELNAASLEDWNLWANTMVPYFHRPLLYALVKAWQRVQAREGSALKRFKCPIELRNAREPNPDLQVVQNASIQVLQEMEEAGVDALTDGGPKGVVIGPAFYRRLLVKLLEGERSSLLNLRADVRDPILDDVSNEAFHSFDQVDYRTMDNDTGNTPPIRIGG